MASRIIIAKSEVTGISPAEYASAGRKAIDESFQLWDVAAEELNLLLTGCKIDLREKQKSTNGY